MSFILDALKKSESDRQRKNRPESAHIPTGTEESSPSRWLMIVVVLLLINVVVVLVVTLWPDQADEVSMPAAASSPQEADQPDSFRDLVANARDRQAGQTAETPAAVTPPPATSTPQPQANTVPAATPSTLGAAYRTLNEVRADGTVQLPELRLDLHVYGGRPAERFVFINMNKYGEGAILSEGPFVTEIVPEGVILEHLGTRFLLPRE